MLYLNASEWMYVINDIFVWKKWWKKLDAVFKQAVLVQQNSLVGGFAAPSPVESKSSVVVTH